MSKWFSDKELVGQLNLVKDKMTKNVSSGDLYLNGSLDYLFLSGGKMIRPALLLIGSRFGKQYKKKEIDVINLSTAIETLHLATLLHDDVIDDAKLRRGQESIQSKYSKEYAIYMGDFLLSKCFLLLTELTIPKELAIRLANTVTRICIGEIKQQQNRFNANISIREYFRIVSGKTASLFAISLAAGAYITKCNNEIIKKLIYIGYELGLAFQIIDDLLDYVGDIDVVGKELKSDLLRGNFNTPLILALNSQSIYKDRIKSLIDNGINNSNVDEIIDLVKKSGALEQTKALAFRYHDRALSLLQKLPSNSGNTLLKDLIPNLLERIY